MTFGLRHLLAAVVLHALLFALLFGGLQCSRKPVKPPVIRAVLLDPDRKELQQQKRLDEQRRREAEFEKKKQQEEARRKLEEEQKRQQALALKKKQEDEEARKQRELAEKKKAEEEARRKKEQEEERERQEQTQREVQEKARMEEEMRREAVRRELDREQAARAATERERKLALWVDALSRHIARNWVRPTGSATRFECQVRMQQLPDGTVTFARIVKSCGNSPLDKSVEDAVFRSSPLPRPADPSIFERELIITFIPES